MRQFKNIAELIKSKRLQHPKGYSQSELSHLLGYKNGQFISNVERALCNIPLKMLTRVSVVLEINPDDLKRAILRDHEETLDNYLNAHQSGIGGAEVKSIRPQETSETMSTQSSDFVSSENYKMSSNS
jgi:hypothetical protein